MQTSETRYWRQRPAMRAVVVIVFVAALAAGVASVVGSAAAAHRGTGSASRSAISPSWSPDGKQILFGQVGGKRNRIVRTSSRPGGAIRIVHVGSPPGTEGRYPEPLFWAPGGRILFRDLGTNIWYRVGVQGGKPKQIALSPNAQELTLTPKRAYAAVTIQDTHDPASIALLKLRLGRNPIVTPTPLAAQERSGAISDYILSFSPHGKQLIFMRYGWRNPCTPENMYGCETGPGALMAFRLGSGRAPVPLAQSGLRGASLVPSDAQQVQWSPDGRWIAFAKGSYPRQDLEVIPTSGASAPRALPPCPAPEFLWAPYFRPSYSWSPTSKLIAYDCHSPTMDGAELVTVRPDGTHPTNPLAGRPLTHVSGPEPAQWSPDGSRLLFLAHAGPPAVGDSRPTVHVWTIRPNGAHLTRLD